MKEAEQYYNYLIKEYEICQTRATAISARFWQILLGLIGLSLAGIIFLKETSLETPFLSTRTIVGVFSISVAFFCIRILKRERFILRCLYYRLQNLEKEFFEHGGINCLIDKLDKVEIATQIANEDLKKLWLNFREKTPSETFSSIINIVRAIILFWFTVILIPLLNYLSKIYCE